MRREHEAGIKLSAACGGQTLDTNGIGLKLCPPAAAAAAARNMPALNSQPLPARLEDGDDYPQGEMFF